MAIVNFDCTGNEQIMIEAFFHLLHEENTKTVVGFFDPLDNPKQRIGLTRKSYGAGVRTRGRGLHLEPAGDIAVTIGRLNYAEREFVKLCKKAKTHPKRFWFRPFPKKKK